MSRADLALENLRSARRLIFSRFSCKADSSLWMSEAILAVLTAKAPQTFSAFEAENDKSSRMQADAQAVT